MTDKPFPEIKTNRLLLRKLRLADWEIISFMRSDKEVNKYVNRPSAETKAEAISFIEKINQNNGSQAYYWIITEIDHDEMIGSICLWNISENDKEAEVGYDLHPKYQGKGIMNEALSEVLDFGFKQLNLEKIEAYTHRENEPSKKLLIRNNFSLVEGKTDADNKNNRVFELTRESKLAHHH